MFTTEMDHDEISITVLDDGGSYEDVNYLIYDDMIYIRQWDEEHRHHNVISMSPRMLAEFLAAMKTPEGAYRIS